MLYWKMWRSWWTGESHVDLEADGLAIGPVLMSFIRWERGKDEGWAVKENGKPVTVASIAARAKWTTERTIAALHELQDAKTIRLRRDGAWGFPKWGPWQESAEAARKRKVRGVSGGRPGQKPDMSGTSPPDVPALVEVDVEASSSLRSEPTPTPPEPRPEDPIDAAAKRVLAHLNATLVSLGEPGKFRDRTFIRARLNDGATEAECVLVIDARADECRAKPAAIAHLNPKTPFRPGNWETAVAHARAWSRTRKPAGPRLDLDVSDLDRRRAENEAFDREHRPWLLEGQS